MVSIAINGFGRIGRQAFRAAFNKKNITIAAINDLADTKTLAHLLKYDTTYGAFDAEVGFDERHLIVNGVFIPVSAEKDPAHLPWGALAVDVVLECTGRFTDKPSAEQHIQAGAKKVVISAPAKGGVTTYVLGVNDKALPAESAAVVNNASCTTNCIAPVMAVLEKTFGIAKAMMTTVHAYTADQSLQDTSHKDLRRARSAAANIVPTTTGAAIATAEVVPSLKGKFDGLSIRVPVTSVSLSDITVVLNKDVTKEEVNEALVAASKEAQFKGILAVTDQELVSSDFIGNPFSSVVDLKLTNVVGGNLVKVVAWYDNEYGYAHRLVEIAERFAQ